MTSNPANLRAASTLLATKLHRPRTPVPLVARPRLLDKMSAGLNHRLTLISAPAGYGKTTAANQWLDTMDLPWAWISLDEYDDDLASFLRYILAAVRSVYPDACYSCELLLGAPNLPSPERLADSLLHDLDILSGSLVVVLDDYHVIRSKDIHEAMRRVVQHLPSHVHLILTTRADPPLSLEKLRGRQQITEIRSVDLRFTTEEAAILLRQMLGAETAAETIALLEDSTEGWAVGLQMAAISLQGRGNPVDLARNLARGSHYLVTDYLMTEVLQSLPTAQREYLLQTSLLDRFCVPICDAIRGEAARDLSGEDFLHLVRRSNLFLVPLDDEGTWFRYHSLFLYMLRSRTRQDYSERAIREIHARASAWFAAQDLVDEAMTHATKAGDVQQAATLVEEHVHAALNREDWRQVERWLAHLPADALKRPRLLVVQAWLHYIRYQLASVGGLLDAAETALADDSSANQGIQIALRGEINTLRAALAYHQSDAQRMVQGAELAIQQLRPDMQYAIGMASFFKIAGLHLMGQNAAAVEFAQSAIDQAYGRHASVLVIRPLLALASIHYELVELSALQAVAEMLQRVAHQAGLVLGLTWSYCLLGWVHYQRNELATAEECFRNLVLKASAAHGRAAVDGYTGLVLTLLAQGLPDEALETIGKLRELLLERGLLALVPIADSLQQRVWLVSDTLSTTDWSVTNATASLPFECWEQPVLTQVRRLLAQGTPNDLDQAAGLLAESRATASVRHSTRRLIEVAGLEALVFAAQGKDASAVAALREAVDRAAMGGAMRLLVDCGPGLISEMQKLRAAGVAPAYIQQVIAAFGMSAVSTRALPPSQRALGHDSAVGVLTNREIDVLCLLAERLTDKEIAKRLVLSLATVRKHTLHIYRKLGVDNRRAAAAEARRLDLI